MMLLFCFCNCIIFLFYLTQPLGKVPKCFAREFGDVISPYVILRDPNNNEFEVHVIKMSKKLYFDDGWFGLKDVCDLPFGAWVTLPI
jgi:hypothetical protein